MKALICKLQSVENFDGTSGFVVAQIIDDNELFDVAEDLYWMDCENLSKNNVYYLDNETKLIKEIPIDPNWKENKQPKQIGTQTI